MIERRIPVSGDPFYAASRQRRDDQEGPHGCIDGWVYLGFEGEDENGEYVEDVERVPCRCCQLRSSAEL
jgi:hypothetical protein